MCVHVYVCVCMCMYIHTHMHTSMLFLDTLSLLPNGFSLIPFRECALSLKYLLFPLQHLHRECGVQNWAKARLVYFFLPSPLSLLLSLPRTLSLSLSPNQLIRVCRFQSQEMFLSSFCLSLSRSPSPSLQIT